MQVLANAVLPREMAAAPAGGSGSDNTNSATTNSANITANDFLELLVSEMKNQDPTAQQDPNEYINQLVQVNSLEQLVQINSDLSGSSSSGDTGSTTHTVAGAMPAGGTGASTAGTAPPSASVHKPAAVNGNLSSSSANSAAMRVASAMGLPGASPSAASSPGTGTGAGGTLPQGNSFDAIVSALRHRNNAVTLNPLR